LIVWCITGGGDFFDENYRVFTHLLSKKYPILTIFSDAGALVYNRYGFFWKLYKSNLKMTNLHVLFESQYVLDFNIAQLLKQTRINYSVLPKDPTFAKGIWLANYIIKCIIASPLTSNSVAKLVTGINDTLILNILSAGKKAGQLIGILPTDRGSDSITSTLPVRQRKPLNSVDMDLKVCPYDALDSRNLPKVEYRSEYCVGCRICVEKYPEYFTVDEKIEIYVRSIDQQNTQKLSDEFRVFHSVDEISVFISSL
jgi:dihydromethanopterin reductase (acceptor)